MTHGEALLALHAWLYDRVECRRWFLGEGVAVGRRDEAALILNAVTAASSAPPRAVVQFVCAMGLDPDGPPVTRWVEECVAAARREVPEVVAAAGELVVVCTPNAMPGLTP